MILKNVEKKEKNTAAFAVECDANEFEKAVNDAYRKSRSSISIPGFRKGKAPRAVIEGMYGHEVFYQDAMDELAPEAYEFGLKESALNVVGAPAIENVEVTDARTACFTFAVSLYPEVTLGQYKGLEAVKLPVEVSDEEVEAELNAARKRGARMLDIDDREARMGDTANIDFDGYLDGERFDGGKAEGYSLELGSNSFVPGFEEQVAGMKIGEEKEIAITFPADYTPELAGKDVVFKVKLNSLTMPELPELDDEFAKDVSEFDTLEEYKASIRDRLVKEKTEKVEAVDKVILDPSMTSGVQEVEEGNDGEGVFTYTTKYVNGKKKGTEREVKEWITEPHDNVLRLGTSATGNSGEYVVTKTFTANTTAYTAGSGARGALGQSVHVGTCAVDPGFVSLRSELWVEGYGYAYANDTGGAVKGNVVDLYMGSRGQCISWGRRNVTAYVIVPEGD